MSSSSAWSSSSEDEENSEEEDLFDSDGIFKSVGKKSQESAAGGREKAGTGKLPPPRLSPLYILDKALSCRQLVKQVQSKKDLMKVDMGKFTLITRNILMRYQNLLLVFILT